MRDTLDCQYSFNYLPTDRVKTNNNNMPKKALVNVLEYVQQAEANLDLEEEEPQRLKCTSPRSLEACLRCGVEPEQLLPQPLAAFYSCSSPSKPNSRQNVQQVFEHEAAKIKYDHFETCRRTQVESVSQAYRELLAQEASSTQPLVLSMTKMRGSSTGGGGGGTGDEPGSASPAPGAGHDSNAPDPNLNSTMVQNEERRLERMKRRQEKEIESLIESETKMARLQQLHTERETLELKKAARLEAQKQKKKAEAAAAKRARELRRKAEEEAEVERRRDIASRASIQEKKFQQAQAQAEAEAQAQAQARELVRVQQAAEHRRQTQALIEAQERQTLLNRDRMLEREKEVAQKLEQVAKDKVAQAQESRARAQARLTQAQVQQTELGRARELAFHTKQHLASQRALAQSKAQTQKQVQAKAKSAAAEKLRQSRVASARASQARRTAELVAKRESLERHLSEVYAARELERLKQNLVQSLESEAKSKQVERMNKQAEFHRLETLRKIQADDSRSRALKSKKHELIRVRKAFALESQRRKSEIAEAVEQMRVSNNWGAMDKLLGTKSNNSRGPPGSAPASAQSTTSGNAGGLATGQDS